MSNVTETIEKISITKQIFFQYTKRRLRIYKMGGALPIGVPPAKILVSFESDLIYANHFIHAPSFP